METGVSIGMKKHPDFYESGFHQSMKVIRQLYHPDRQDVMFATTAQVNQPQHTKEHDMDCLEVSLNEKCMMITLCGWLSISA